MTKFILLLLVNMYLCTRSTEAILIDEAEELWKEYLRNPKIDTQTVSPGQRVVFDCSTFEHGRHSAAMAQYRSDTNILWFNSKGETITSDVDGRMRIRHADEEDYLILEIWHPTALEAGQYACAEVNWYRRIPIKVIAFFQLVVEEELLVSGYLGGGLGAALLKNESELRCHYHPLMWALQWSEAELVQWSVHWIDPHGKKYSSAQMNTNSSVLRAKIPIISNEEHKGKWICQAERLFFDSEEQESKRHEVFLHAVTVVVQPKRTFIDKIPEKVVIKIGLPLSIMTTWSLLVFQVIFGVLICYPIAKEAVKFDSEETNFVHVNDYVKMYMEEANVELGDQTRQRSTLFMDEKTHRFTRVTLLNPKLSLKSQNQ